MLANLHERVLAVDPKVEHLRLAILLKPRPRQRSSLVKSHQQKQKLPLASRSLNSHQQKLQLPPAKSLLNSHELR